MIPAYSDDWATVWAVDALEGATLLEPQSVHTIVTSPPYWGLRSYLSEDDPNKALELGAEKTPEEYVRRIVEIFRALKPALRDDGTLWCSLGDSYASSGTMDVSGNSRLHEWNGDGAVARGGSPRRRLENNRDVGKGRAPSAPGLKPKDLVGIPWMAAFALRADGWYLRRDIIWNKPNPMPESVTDRPTSSHEYVFLLSKSPRYFFDQEAVKEPATEIHRRPNVHQQASNPVYEVPGARVHNLNAKDNGRHATGRNIRSVWTIATKPFSGHALLRGRAGTESEDCPVHGESDLAQSSRAKAQRDALKEARKRRNVGKGSRRAQAHEAEAVAKTSRRIESGYPEPSERERIRENKGESRMLGEPTNVGAATSPDEISPRTNRTPAQPSSRDATYSYSVHNDALTASERSTRTHKRDPSSEAYEASGGEPSRTEYSERLFDFAEPRPDKRESNTSRAGSAARLSDEITARTADKLSCTCIIPDHYATFPPDLVYPCIKAATSERGVCAACGAPWERVVEKTETEQANAKGSYFDRGKTGSRNGGDRTQPGKRFEGRVVGWQPTCGCEAETVPATVLDPFVGSGTALWAARKLGRKSIGFDLDPRNIALIEERMGTQGVLF